MALDYAEEIIPKKWEDYTKSERSDLLECPIKLNEQTKEVSRLNKLFEGNTDIVDQIQKLEDEKEQLVKDKEKLEKELKPYRIGDKSRADCQKNYDALKQRYNNLTRSSVAGKKEPEDTLFMLKFIIIFVLFVLVYWIASFSKYMVERKKLKNSMTAEEIKQIRKTQIWNQLVILGVFIFTCVLVIVLVYASPRFMEIFGIWGRHVKLFVMAIMIDIFIGVWWIGAIAGW